MSPIEIEEQLSKLAAAPFDSAEFPYQLLECLGRKATEIKSLKKGKSNKSDLGGVLQRNNAHILVVETDRIEDALTELSESKATAKNKAHFIIATDGQSILAENLKTADRLACDYEKLGDEFTFFLPLAGIFFTAEIKNQEMDVKATARLNKLYMELLKENPDWSTPERRHDLNQFMARLIFCFFAEDTDIFTGSDLFTNTIKQMSDSRSGNVKDIIAELFCVMDTPPDSEARKSFPIWKNKFPHVNGGLFGGNRDVPKFSRIARSYMIAAGELNWSKINPDIFGSMIQAVADDNERGSLGMHYTSVPNILKVLNPLFLDDLRAQLEGAGNNVRKLLNLRKRIANIRVFDPACGSGNFLVIAYKELRKIESEILDLRGDKDRNTVISLENFYGIEIKDFAAQIAQIALLIAEFQCDVIYIDQIQACKNMLPLDKANNIVIGNALREDWLMVCPPTAPVDIVKHTDDDLFATPLEQTEINLDEENLGGETYICGNPPYKGSKERTPFEHQEHNAFLESRLKKYKTLDFVACWFVKASEYLNTVTGSVALVATNSVCQGEQVDLLWTHLLADNKIKFAVTSFKWKNLAKKNAGVTCVIVCLNKALIRKPVLFDGDQRREVENISPYLVPTDNVIVKKSTNALSRVSEMKFGNHPYYGSKLIVSAQDATTIIRGDSNAKPFLRPLYGSIELTNGRPRYCIWVTENNFEAANSILEFRSRFESTRKEREREQGKRQASFSARSHSL